jgi:hypothetical protein
MKGFANIEQNKRTCAAANSIAYCLLPIAYCLLPIAYCLLPIAYCHCLLPTAFCLLHTNQKLANLTV